MSHPLRILHLASTKRWTGVAEPMLNLAFHQKGLGHDVWIGCGPGRSLEKQAELWGLSFLPGLCLSGRMNPFEIFPDIRTLKMYIRQIRPHTIHCHLLHDHWVAAAARWIAGAGVPLYRTMHRFEKPYGDPLHSFLFQHVTDGIIAPSGAMKDLILERYPKLESRVFVVSGGVNQERFHPGVDGSTIRRELGIPPGAPVVGIVSRLRKDRGFDRLFRILPSVLSSVPDAVVMIVGKGELARDIRSWIQTEPFKDRVVMAGYRSDDLPNVYRAMNLSLFIALGSEGGCRAAMEAMAAGRPVVGSDVGPIREMIRDGVDGYVIPEGNDALLSERITGMLGDLPRTAEMGRAARERAAEKFSLRSNANQTVGIYRSRMKNLP